MALSAEAQRALKIFIEDEAAKWAKKYIESRQGYLEAKKIKASGSLAASFSKEITTELGSIVRTSLTLAFDDSGRLIDMKRPKRGKGGDEMVKNIVQWINDKGFAQAWLQRFQKKRNLKSPPRNALNAMAWGVIINRQKRYRRRAWYAKSKSASITDLYNSVAGGLPDIVVKELKASFKK